MAVLPSEDLAPQRAWRSLEPFLLRAAAVVVMVGLSIAYVWVR